MATTTPRKKIRTLGPGSFVITADGTAKDFSADLTKAALTPSNSSDDPTMYLDGSEESSTKTSWTFEGTIGSDYSEAGLPTWLFDNAGKTFPAKFIPSNEGDQEWDFDVTVSPVAIGGDVKSQNTSDFSFPALNVKHKTKA